jgi:hypothetical protein
VHTVTPGINARCWYPFFARSALADSFCGNSIHLGAIPGYLHANP